MAKDIVLHKYFSMKIFWIGAVSISIWEYQNNVEYEWCHHMY